MEEQLGTLLGAIIIVVIYSALITLLYGSFKDIFIPDTKREIKNMKERYFEHISKKKIIK